MRVVALTPYPEPAPSTRFRVAQFREPLAEEGVKLEILSFFAPREYGALYRPGRTLEKIRILGSALRRRRNQIREAGTADLVIVHRELAPVFPGTFLRFLNPGFPPVVFDFDDAVFLSPRGGSPFMRPFRRPHSSTAGLCDRADLVLAGNAYLAEFASRVRRRRRDGVEVLPTVIDTDAYAPLGGPAGGKDPFPSSDLPVVGWIGTHSTLPYLEVMSQALAEAASRAPFRLLVVCNRPPQGLGPEPEVEFREWSAEREVSDLREMDVGIYPLPDDPWTLGKCGFKAIQFMACGIPLVASSVGVLREIILHEKTGFLAEATDGWVEGLTELIVDRERRRAMGEEGRLRAEAEYSVTAALPRLVARFRRLAS